MANIEYPVAQDAVKTPLPFSPATKVGDLLFISGQASTDDDGKVVLDTFDNCPASVGIGEPGHRS